MGAHGELERHELAEQEAAEEEEDEEEEDEEEEEEGTIADHMRPHAQAPPLSLGVCA